MSRMTDVFRPIYEHKLWGSEDASGTGSTLDQTAAIREQLPEMFKKLDIRSILDIPCDTHNWWAHMNAKHQMGIAYTGADVVPELIEENKRIYPHTRFCVLDITRDELPQADAVFVRDLFGHFSNQDISRAMANIVKSNPKYLIATTFPGVAINQDIRTGGWRPFNLALLQQQYGLRSIALMDEKLLDKNGKNIGKKLGIYEFRERDLPTDS